MHPAGTSDGSVICGDFTSFWFRFCNGGPNENIFGSIHKNQYILLEILLYNYILYQKGLTYVEIFIVYLMISLISQNSNNAHG